MIPCAHFLPSFGLGVLREEVGMQFRKVRALRGPNVWAPIPVLEGWVEFEEPALSTAQLPGLAERLLDGLPSLADHRPAFALELRRGTDLGTVLAHLALEFQTQARSPVDFGRSAATAEPRIRCLAVAYEYEPLGRACLEAARQFCLAVLHGRPFDVAAEVRRCRDLYRKIRRGTGATAIFQAAQARGIPAEPLSEPPCNLFRLGHGVNQRRVGNTSTDRTGCVPSAIAQDKELTRAMLREAGIPVPEGRPVADAADAWEAARQFGLPVVVKPRDSDHGRGVSLHLTTWPEVQAAYAEARQESDGVLVERQAPGWHHRLVVIGGRLVAAVRRDPAQVVGDGIHTVGQLIDQANADPRRVEDGPLSPILVDAAALALLAEAGYTLESVPPAGARVLVRRNSRLRDGGTLADVTARVHPEVAARAVEAVRIVGLDIAGLDVVAEDLGRPLEEQGGVIVEVNETPWLGQHLMPLCDPPRPLGEAILELLYPPGQTGRIPIAAVTGTAGRTSTTRLITHILGFTGRRIGMACPDGAYAAGRRIKAGDGRGAQGTRAVLRNPVVEAAVLETSWRGILREGLGFDRCNVTVVTGVGRTGESERLARARQVPVEAVAPDGAAVLRADDPVVAALAGYCPGSVVFFAQDPDCAVIAEHRDGGGRAVFVRDGEILLAEGPRETSLARLADIPRANGGRAGFPVESVLAAAAATWALGLPLEEIHIGLRSFGLDPVREVARG
jgi:cyanophycin synthetase